MSIMFPLDMKLTRGMAPLQLHYSSFNLSNPDSISSDLSLTKPVIATIANFLSTPEHDESKRARMFELFT